MWCILACVLPSRSHAIKGFQGVYSPHFACVRTIHAPSLTHRSCQTLTNNREILLCSLQNFGQGDIRWPTAGTPTPKKLMSNWDFLPWRSPGMLAGQTPSIGPLNPVLDKDLQCVFFSCLCQHVERKQSIPNKSC